MIQLLILLVLLFGAPFVLGLLNDLLSVVVMLAVLIAVYAVAAVLTFLAVSALGASPQYALLSAVLGPSAAVAVAVVVKNMAPNLESIVFNFWEVNPRTKVFSALVLTFVVIPALVIITTDIQAVELLKIMLTLAILPLVGGTLGLARRRNFHIANPISILGALPLLFGAVILANSAAGGSGPDGFLVGAVISAIGAIIVVSGFAYARWSWRK